MRASTVASVWVVRGHINYEGSDIIGVYDNALAASVHAQSAEDWDRPGSYDYSTVSEWKVEGTFVVVNQKRDT
jgi:hypothetical protein